MINFALCTGIQDHSVRAWGVGLITTRWSAHII
jgi:hypothetical protein